MMDSIPPLPLPPLPFGVMSLFVQRFRSIGALQLSLPSKPVVFVARNGFGKTNLLEALSLFSPGRGLHNATFADMRQANQNPPLPWQIGLTLTDGENGETHIGTTLTETKSGAERRVIKKEGELLRSQGELTDILNIVWLTPSMDGLLSDSGQVQRQFIDRLTYAHCRNHAELRSQYDKTLRERMKILEVYGPTSPAHTPWLDTLEEKLATLNYAITRNRMDLVASLNELQSTTPLFPKFEAKLTGDIEEMFASSASDSHEETAFTNALRSRLAANRSKDQLRGSCGIGIHKTKLRVTHLKKGFTAEFCSTGEQKMLLFALILAFIKKKRMQGLLLLMDDVVDHLDVQHKKVLLDEIKMLSPTHKIQPWLTGNDIKAFEPILDVAHLLDETIFDRA